MPPKNPNPKASKAKAKPREEQREESLQAVVSVCVEHYEDNDTDFLRSLLTPLKRDSNLLLQNVQE